MHASGYSSDCGFVEVLASSSFAGGTEPAALHGVVVFVNVLKRRPT